MPGRNSMCIGNQKGVSRLGPLVVSFPSQVINEKIHINFRFFLFFLYSSHVLSTCLSIFENSSEKTSRRNNDNYNTSKCARGYEQQYLFVQKLVFSKTQHFIAKFDERLCHTRTKSVVGHR